MKSFLTIVPWLTIAAFVYTAGQASDSVPVDAVASFEFVNEAPPGWHMGDGWAFSAAGATASSDCTAAWSGQVPQEALVEVVLDLPDASALEKNASVSLSIGSGSDDPALVTASCVYGKTSFKATLTGANGENGKVSVSASGDTRPSVLRQNKMAEQHPGWASVTVSLGVVLRHNDGRMMLNGSEAERAALAVPEERKLVLAADGVTVRGVRILSAPPAGYVYLSGAGVAMGSGGLATRAATGRGAGRMESCQIRALGIPMIVQRAPEGIMTLDIGAEQYASRRYNQESYGEGIGFLAAPIPRGIYSAAYLLLYRDLSPDSQAAMGFGLRPPGRNAGELKNVYIGEIPETAADEGVSVRPVPALGHGWFLARVPLNPATLQWYKDDTVFPRETGSHGRVHFQACRPWSFSGTPAPHGKRSSLHLAAVSIEESAIDLVVTGNGLGNVFCEPATPAISATLRNLTDRSIRARVRCELLPFERPAKARQQTIVLKPNGSATFDALAAEVRERGHYRVRVVADAGNAGRIEYRTNLALLAPDTRQKIDSPFGIWPGTWGDESSETQRDYLVEKLGVGLLRSEISYYGVGHWENVSHVPRPIPDDAAAEEFVRQQSKDLRFFMLGWECGWQCAGWSNETLMSFPSIISEGKPVVETPELSAEVEKCVETWRRLIRATRKLRPDVKISLGNSGVNFVIPLLERGFKHGVEFDYFGTEEPMVGASPERPADAIGNVNWWVKAICEHYGFRDVPVFKGETMFYGTGPGFSRMSARAQAAYYVRAHLLGFPYDAVFGMPATSVDSSIGYAYTMWGSAGYINQGPECSPKPSYVAYATLTQMLDGAKYDGMLDAGTTSMYAMRFRQPDGTALYAIWNLRGRRQVTVRLAAAEPVEVLDAFNRPVKVSPRGRELVLEASDLPLYLRGAEIATIEPGPYIDERLPERILLNSLDRRSDWTVDTEADTDFEAPGGYTGVPKVMGEFAIAYKKGLRPPGTKVRRALTFTLNPLPTKHGLIPRYVSLSAKPGREIPIPAGTTELGMWVYGNSTWAEVKLGVENEKGDRRLILAGDRTSRMADNFDGWHFLHTGDLGPEIASGLCKVNRLVVTMPEQQVYVDELLTTPKPEIVIWGLFALNDPPPSMTYLPW